MTKDQREELWAKALDRIEKKKKAAADIDPEHRIVLEYRELMQTKIGKQARAEITARHNISTATLYRYLRVYGDLDPWEKTYRGIIARCKGNPLYVGQGIRCRITVAELKAMWIRDGADKMERPSIDRIDPAGDYVFHNCRFIELHENCARARTYKVVDKPRPHENGEIAKGCRKLGQLAGSLARAAKLMGVNPATFYQWAKGYKLPNWTHSGVLFNLQKHMRRIEKLKAST